MFSYELIYKEGGGKREGKEKRTVKKEKRKKRRKIEIYRGMTTVTV